MSACGVCPELRRYKLAMGTNRGHELELQIVVAIDSPLRLIGRIRSGSLAPYNVHGQGNH